MKKILTLPLIVMFFVFLMITIITFVIALNYIYLDLYTSLTLSISVASLFSTFGGAFLGAKVSGEYATKTMKEQLKMSELINNSENNINFLNDLSIRSNILLHINKTENKELEIIKNTFNWQVFINNIGGLLNLIDDSFKTSSIIRINYNSLYKSLCVFSRNYDLYISDLESLIKKYIIDEHHKNEEDITIRLNPELRDLIIQNHMNSKDLILVNYDVYDIEYEYKHFSRDKMKIKYNNKEMIDFNKVINSKLNDFKTTYNKCLESETSLLKTYNNMIFKNVNDYNEYITDFYKK